MYQLFALAAAEQALLTLGAVVVVVGLVGRIIYE
jgi:hypothetical protein